MCKMEEVVSKKQEGSGHEEDLCVMEGMLCIASGVIYVYQMPREGGSKQLILVRKICVWRFLVSVWVVTAWETF